MNYIITDRALTVFHDGTVHTVHRDDARWDKAIDLLKQGKLDSLVALIRPAQAVARYISESGDLTIEDGVMKYKGQALDNTMYFVKRTIQQMTEGFPVDPLIKFIENLMQNPSFRAQHELLQFLEYGQLPITSDGHFLAYKRVRDDYKDVYSGKIDNSVGQVVEMPRAQVDDNSDRTCSYGLHFCSREYLSAFTGERMMVLKINPRDVVSIPTDYNNTKGRCCRYEVVGELPEEYDPTRGNAWDNSVVDSYDSTPEVTQSFDFQVGDRVYNDTHNELGEVVNIDPARGDEMYLVEYEDSSRAWSRKEELTKYLYLDEGTRILVIDPDHELFDQYGWIDEIDAGDVYPYRIETDNGEIRWVRAEQIEVA